MTTQMPVHPPMQRTPGRQRTMAPRPPIPILTNKLTTMSKYLQFIIFFPILLCFQLGVQAQDDVYPAKPYKGKLYITNGTIHVGNGQVIEKGTIVVDNGKIVQVGANISAGDAGGAKVIDANGKQVYPGLILPVTDLGLKEIGSGVRGSNDYLELGDLNPSVRS